VALAEQFNMLFEEMSLMKVVMSRKTFLPLFHVHMPKWAVEAYAGGVERKGRR
jgi:hypothetical protein